MSNITIKYDCVICGAHAAVTVDEEGYARWRKGELIQRCLPTATRFQREQLVSQMCQDCLSETYNCPKDGEDWGEQLGECEMCGAPLWEKNRNEEDRLKCPCCGFAEGADEDE